MTLAATVLSLALQTVASLVAFRVARTSGRIAWLFLAQGALLMAARRAFTLHGHLFSGRGLDTGAESIALAISILMLGGLMNLSRPAASELADKAPSSSPRQAARLELTVLAVGLAAILGSAAAGYQAYVTSRDGLIAGVIRTSAVQAGALRARARLCAEQGLALPEIRNELLSLWEELAAGGPAGTYFCLIDRDGRLAANTREPSSVGSPVGTLVLSDATPPAPHNLAELLSRGQDYRGRFRSAAGEPQLAAFAYAAQPGALVAIHVPMSSLEREVRDATYPWGTALLLIVGALVPLGLATLHFSYRNAERSASRAEDALKSRLAQQAALAELASGAVEGRSLRQLFDATVRRVAATLEVDYCKILERQPDGRLLLVAGTGWREGLVGRATVDDALDSQAGYTLSVAAPVVVLDLASETRFRGPALLLEHGVQSGVSVVIAGADGRAFGVLGAHSRRRREFDADDVGFLQTVAHLLAASIRDSRGDEVRRQVEERFEKAFRASPAAMTLTTLSDARFLDANDRFLELAGYSRGEVLGRAVHELGFWFAASDRERMVETLVQERSCHGFAFRYRCKDRSVRDAKGSFELVDVAGERCVLSLIEDVSEVRRLEAQLRQGQKMEAVGRLAGGIAHDFNNVLNVILGHGELLRRETADDPTLARRIGHVLRAADRAAGLTRQLLAFSRRQVLQPRVIDLNALLLDVEGMLRRVIGEQIRIVTRLAPAPAPVKIDPGQIEQVVMNLALNARDAMQDGGTLTLETQDLTLEEPSVRGGAAVPPGRYAVLRVCDTGHGMDDDTLAKVFEPFFTTKADGKGTGLGLATAYGIVKQSGGSIWVQSEPGGGTTFEVYLPRSEEPLSAQEPVATGEFLQGREMIVVAEDEPQALDLIREVLSDAGYRVIACAGGAEALEQATRQATPPNLLLTDVVMPEMNGVELAKRLCAVAPTLRVLYMSGYTDDVLARHRVLDPGVAFLEKPFSPDALLRAVRALLDRSAEG